MKNRYRLMMACGLILISSIAFAQTSSDAKVLINDINTHLKSYRTIAKIDESNWGTEGNKITYYYDGNILKKISATYYGENGKLTDEYYFNKRSLIFYHSKEENYKMPIYVNTQTQIASIKEKRYYFNANKVFKVSLNPTALVSATEMQQLSINTQKEAKRLQTLK